MTPLLCILRPAPFCPVTPFFVPSHSGKSYSLSFSLARQPKSYPDTHLPPHSSCSPLPLIPPSSFPFQFYEGTLQNGVSDIERQFTGADLKWPNPSRPMYFLVSTGNEEMASTGESALLYSDIPLSLVSMRCSAINVVGEKTTWIGGGGWGATNRNEMSGQVQRCDVSHAVSLVACRAFKRDDNDRDINDPMIITS